MIQTSHRLSIFPLWRTLKGYTREQARADFQAGLNVCLLDFPQAMAYALLAGFPVTFGIFASAIGSIVGPIFASSRYVVLGPTNAVAILVLSTFLTMNLSMEERFIALPLLVLMVGVFMIAGAFLKLAGFVKYISRTVITGYFTAAALIIIVNQLHAILGTEVVRAGTFFEALKQNFYQIEDFQWESVLIALITAICYIGINRYFRFIPRVGATLIVVSVVTIGMHIFGVEIPRLDPAQIKDWHVTIPTFNFELINQLGGAAIAIAFLGILESASIAKTLAARSGRQVDLDQHLLSMGMANVGSAIGSGLPISASISRSMLNYTSGARTPIASMVSGSFLLIGIMVLGPSLHYIPKVALAMIVIFVGISLINIENIKIVISSTRADATVFFVTFLGGLFFPLNMSIYLGAAASIILFLQKVSEPKLVEYAFNARGELSPSPETRNLEETPEISIVHVEGELFFGSTDIFLDQTRLICSSPNLKVIILRMRNAIQLDATSAMAIADLIRFAQENKRHFIVSGANKSVQSVFRHAGVMELLGENNFFLHSIENPNLSTRRALKRAQELLGVDQAKILLFTTPHKDKDGEDSVNG